MGKNNKTNATLSGNQKEIMDKIILLDDGQNSISMQNSPRIPAESSKSNGFTPVKEKSKHPTEKSKNYLSMNVKRMLKIYPLKKLIHTIIYKRIMFITILFGRTRL